MNRFLLSSLIVCLVTNFAQAADAKAPPADKASNSFTFAGQFSVTAPEGYTWQKNGGDADKPLSLVATKKDSTSRLVIIFEPNKADTDVKRSARLKGLYNGMLKSLPQTGITPTKAKAPVLTPPIPDRVQFSIAGKTKENVAVAMRGVMIFGKNTYHIQVAAPTDEEADVLAKSTESIKEP